MNWVQFTTEEFPVLLEGNIGCSVPESWGFYVRLFLEDLSWLQETLPELSDLRIKQIKEKFGSLRIYCDTTSLSDLDKESISAKISIVEAICAQTCVECGSHKDVVNTTKQDGGWLSPRCPDHR